MPCLGVVDSVIVRHIVVCSVIESHLCEQSLVIYEKSCDEALRENGYPEYTLTRGNLKISVQIMTQIQFGTFQYCTVSLTRRC